MEKAIANLTRTLETVEPWNGRAEDAEEFTEMLDTALTIGKTWYDKQDVNGNPLYPEFREIYDKLVFQNLKKKLPTKKDMLQEFFRTDGEHKHFYSKTGNKFDIIIEIENEIESEKIKVAYYYEKRKQKDNETIKAYSEEIKKKGTFLGYTEYAMITHFIIGLKDRNIAKKVDAKRRKSPNEMDTLKKVSDFAKDKEQFEKQYETKKWKPEQCFSKSAVTATGSEP